MLKKIAHSGVGSACLSTLIGGYVRLTLATTRWKFDGAEHLADLEQSPRGFVIAFWHAQLMLFPAVRNQTGRRAYMLASASRDGEIIARAIAPYGVTFIRGSAANPRKTAENKSGASAILQMVAALDEGGVIGMTPDGPRGPARRVQPGIIRLAARANVPILPVAAASRRCRTLNTWDGFQLAYPFSTGAFVAEPPIRPGDIPEGTQEATQEALAAALNAASRRAAALSTPNP